MDKKFAAYGSDASVSLKESGPITPEMIAAAVERVSKIGMHVLCAEGHLINTQTLKAKRGYCQVCCKYLEWK